MGENQFPFPYNLYPTNIILILKARARAFYLAICMV
jgi:hypothetical protein